MSESTCLCEAVRLSFHGNAVVTMRCHCIDCRRLSGSTNTNNILVPSDNLKIIKGALKTYTNKVESGNYMTSYFCGSCGSTLYRTSTFNDKFVAILVGCVDDVDAIEKAKPEVEIFTRNRPSWMNAIEQAQQNEGTWLPDH